MNRFPYLGGVHPQPAPAWPAGFRWPSCPVCGRPMHGGALFDTGEVYLDAACYPNQQHHHRIEVPLPWPLPAGYRLTEAGARSLGLDVA